MAAPINIPDDVWMNLCNYLFPHGHLALPFVSKQCNAVAEAWFKQTESSFKLYRQIQKREKSFELPWKLVEQRKYDTEQVIVVCKNQQVMFKKGGIEKRVEAFAENEYSTLRSPHQTVTLIRAREEPAEPKTIVVCYYDNNLTDFNTYTISAYIPKDYSWDFHDHHIACKRDSVCHVFDWHTNQELSSFPISENIRDRLKLQGNFIANIGYKKLALYHWRDKRELPITLPDDAVFKQVEFNNQWLVVPSSGLKVQVFNLANCSSFEMECPVGEVGLTRYKDESIGSFRAVENLSLFIGLVKIDHNNLFCTVSGKENLTQLNVFHLPAQKLVGSFVFAGASPAQLWMRDLNMYILQNVEDGAVIKILKMDSTPKESLPSSVQQAFNNFATSISQLFQDDQKKKS